MTTRRVPSSLVWLAALFAAAIGIALVSGGVLYVQTRQAARMRAEAMTGGDIARGEVAVARFGCGGCHIIPGVSGAQGAVGPDLTGVHERATLAGRLPNDPDAMVRLLMHPQRVVPGGAMPDMGVSDRQARDIAALLYAQ